EDLADRPVVRQRAAEVAGEDLAQVVDVLDEDRPVVAGGGEALLELRPGQAAAHGCRDRVTDDTHQEAHERDEDADGGDDEQEADEDVTAEPGSGRLGLAACDGSLIGDRQRCWLLVSGAGDADATGGGIGVPATIRWRTLSGAAGRTGT